MKVIICAIVTSVFILFGIRAIIIDSQREHEAQERLTRSTVIHCEKVTLRGARGEAYTATVATLYDKNTEEHWKFTTKLFNLGRITCPDLKK
jgi:hypothetical protein